MDFTTYMTLTKFGHRTFSNYIGTLISDFSRNFEEQFLSSPSACLMSGASRNRDCVKNGDNLEITKSLLLLWGSFSFFGIYSAKFSGQVFRPSFPAEFSGRFFRPIFLANFFTSNFER